jgi:hypothetical protein
VKREENWWRVENSKSGRYMEVLSVDGNSLLRIKENYQKSEPNMHMKHMNNECE